MAPSFTLSIKMSTKKIIEIHTDLKDNMLRGAKFRCFRYMYESVVINYLLPCLVFRSSQFLTNYEEAHQLNATVLLHGLTPMYTNMKPTDPMAQASADALKTLLRASDAFHSYQYTFQICICINCVSVDHDFLMARGCIQIKSNSCHLQIPFTIFNQFK